MCTFGGFGKPSFKKTKGTTEETLPHEIKIEDSFFLLIRPHCFKHSERVTTGGQRKICTSEHDRGWRLRKRQDKVRSSDTTYISNVPHEINVGGAMITGSQRHTCTSTHGWCLRKRKDKVCFSDTTYRSNSPHEINIEGDDHRWSKKDLHECARPRVALAQETKRHTDQTYLMR